ALVNTATGPGSSPRARAARRRGSSPGSSPQARAAMRWGFWPRARAARRWGSSQRVRGATGLPRVWGSGVGKGLWRDQRPREVRGESRTCQCSAASVRQRAAIGEVRRNSSRWCSPRQTANSAHRRRSAPGDMARPRPVPSSRQNSSPPARRRSGRSKAMCRISRTLSYRTRWNDAMVEVAVSVIAGYLLGSVPVAVLVARAYGVDPREVGDRNPGYWNVREQLGLRAAVPVFAGDMLKGALAALAGLLVSGGDTTALG